MAKTLFITALLIVIIGLLIYMAARQKTVITTPEPKPVETPQAPTPKALEPERGTPTPKAPEEVLPKAGVEIEKVVPQEVNFWVNNIKVPPSTTYKEGLNFIPIKQSNLKTFAGSFGPYFEDPTPHLKVMLCAEFYKIQAAPACEIVPFLFRDRYASFAKGYQYDEYIGGMAAKDYVAYYDVYVGTTPIAHSNKAVIRTNIG